jgi:predicted amidohydrolase
MDARPLFHDDATMHTVRIALANLRFPPTPDDAVVQATRAIEQAAERGALVVCFPECFVPGYRATGRRVSPPDRAYLQRAWADVARTANRVGVGVVLGTERVVDGRGVVASALVVDRDGSQLGFQDKVQLDPSEDGLYVAGAGRCVFQIGDMTFGIVICHEGWRYPETVRWAARRGAQVVFHPQYHAPEPGAYRPDVYGDPANSFHEKAVLCRAAENTCYFATVNYAERGSPTTSAIAAPDGALLAYHPYGDEGLLVADIDLDAANGLLARRYKPLPIDVD